MCDNVLGAGVEELTTQPCPGCQETGCGVKMVGSKSRGAGGGGALLFGCVECDTERPLNRSAPLGTGNTRGRPIDANTQRAVNAFILGGARAADHQRHPPRAEHGALPRVCLEHESRGGGSWALWPCFDVNTTKMSPFLPAQAPGTCPSTAPKCTKRRGVSPGPCGGMAMCWVYSSGMTGLRIYFKNESMKVNIGINSTKGPRPVI